MKLNLSERPLRCLGQTFADEFKSIDRLIISALWWGKVKFNAFGAEIGDFEITKTFSVGWVFYVHTFDEDEKIKKPLCYMKIGKIASFLLDLTKKRKSQDKGD